MKVFRLWSLMLSATMLFLVACESMDEKDGGKYSLGSTCRILESRGNFTSFIKALDRSGYRRLVDGGGLVTVFAPDDAAFGSYLQKKYGTTDVDQVPVEELTLLVGCHMIQFAYTTEDFLSFSMVSSDDGTDTGDGSCYKYKTYGRPAIEEYTDPLNRRKVKIFSREKYMPVFSTRMFAKRGISDAEGDYRLLFPDVNWQGADDRLYAGNAAVTESGIPTDNGYLYIVDKVMEPARTIYKELSDNSSSVDYSLCKGLFDRVSLYKYDAAVSKNYAGASGDSLFYFYHWKEPLRMSEIPEIASEWTYHDESGVVFDRGLRYANNCFLPQDDVLKEYLKNYFSEYGTQTQEDFLDLIPKNAIYHFLRAHVYGTRDLILPSELNMSPVVGVNGEHFNLSTSELKDVRYCSNGVIYGMDKIFEPAVFTRLTAPLFRYPQFSFYARAFNTKNMYQQTVDVNNRFSLFIQNDQDLATAGYSSSEGSTTHGDYTFRSKSGNMNANAVSNLLMSQFVYGDLPALEETDARRYFVAKDEKTYFYVKDKALFDYSGKEVSVKATFDTDNGTVYQTDRVIPARAGAYSETGKLPEYQQFKSLMITAGLGNNSGGLVTPIADGLVFFPTNEAILAAKSARMIPEVVDGDVTELRKYLQYYFVPLKKNKLNFYLLPGLGPEGATDEAYSGRYVTLSEYQNETDAKTMGIAWNPDVPESLTITDMAGNTITTEPGVIYLRTNCATYSINTCFDYRTMYGN
ncbi:fasciclin domain-containing protein [Alistipes finegoldii]|uniref:fasciclin domain-containing protein n=1 Tax=Alistipes finegoldii TaxID=214856 RepID=UPI003AB7E0AC